MADVLERPPLTQLRLTARELPAVRGPRAWQGACGTACAGGWAWGGGTGGPTWLTQLAWLSMLTALM